MDGGGDGLRGGLDLGLALGSDFTARLCAGLALATVAGLDADGLGSVAVAAGGGATDVPMSDVVFICA